MKIQDFLHTYIHNSAEYILTKEDKNHILHSGIESYIYRKLTSSTYRASAIGEDYDKKVHEKIAYCVSMGIPIHVSLPFGAAKNPYLPSAPGIDWAEVFTMGYIRNYLKPIAAAYQHGVIIEYISGAVFEEKVNRIPQSDTDTYDSQFRQLLSYYSNHIPANMTVTYSTIEDLIPRSDIERRLETKIEELKIGWPDVSEDIKKSKTMRAKRNCIFDKEGKDVDAIILNAILGHDAFCSECWTDEPASWDKENMITLGHNYTRGWAIHVRSAQGSSVNFWSGIGVLKQSNEKLIPTVLSPQQFETIEQSAKEEIVAIFDESLPYLSKILVVE